MTTLCLNTYYVLSGLWFTIGKRYRKVSFVSGRDFIRICFYVEEPSDVDFIFFGEAIEDTQDLISQEYETACLVRYEVFDSSRLPGEKSSGENIVFCNGKEMLPSPLDDVVAVRNVEIEHCDVSTAGVRERVRRKFGRDDFSGLCTRVCFANQALLGRISDDLWMVSIGWSPGRTILRFLYDSREAAQEDVVRTIASKYVRLVGNEDEKVLVQICHGDLSCILDESPDYFWSPVFGRRVYHDSEFDYFTEDSDCHRFLEGLEERIEQGKIVEVPVGQGGFGKRETGERWFRDNRDGRLYRLVPYRDEEQEGCYKKIPDTAGAD